MMYKSIFHALCLLLLLSFCNRTQAEVQLPLYAFGVTNTTLSIDAEEATLVPFLANTPLSEAILQEIVPYPGAEHNDQLIQALLAQKNLKLGSSSLYFYLGVVHALDRIFRNRLLGIGYDQDPSAAEIKNDARFSNVRQFAKVQPISGKHLRLRVFFSRVKFDQASKQSRPPSSCRRI